MPRVENVRSADEFEQHMQKSKGAFGGSGVVVDFTATWCGPCKMMAPVFEALSDRYPAVTFLKVDVDEVSDVASSCGVRAMPTFQAFFAGSKVDELVGADQNKLRAMLDKLQANSGSIGTGHKLGGSTSAGAAAAGAAAGGDSADERRARMAAAAEARLRAQAQQ